MEGKSTKFISFNDLEGGKRTSPQVGLFSKLLERVKNTITFDPVPSTSSPITKSSLPSTQKLNNKSDLLSDKVIGKVKEDNSPALKKLRETASGFKPLKHQASSTFSISETLPNFLFNGSDDNSIDTVSIHTNSKAPSIANSNINQSLSTDPLSEPTTDNQLSSTSFLPGDAVGYFLKRLQGEGINKDYWMKDEHCHECYGCNKPFNQFFRRKHHCRICGQIFCGECALQKIPGESLGQPGLIRVCDYCYKVRKPVAHIRPTHPDSSVPIPTEPYARSPSFASAPSARDIAMEEGNTDQIDACMTLDPRSDGLKKLLRAGTRVAHKGSYKTEPTLFSMDGGKGMDDEAFTLVNGSMFRNDTESMLTENMFEPPSQSITPDLKTFSKLDNYSMITGFKDSIANNGSINETELSRNNSVSRKSLMQQNATSPNARKMMRKMTIGSISQSAGSAQKKAKPNHDTHLSASSLFHLRRLLAELLNECDIDAKEGWEEIIQSLVLKATYNINLNVKDGDGMDIRKYVRIKQIQGGVPTESEYVDGVVCTKNLTHKMMPRTLTNPRILILTFPFEYQRVEHQFMSIGPLIAQESEHLKNMVARVLALRPTLVLIEKSVSRIAQEFLNKANLSVAMNVKRSVIRAVARCTGAEIISSLDKLWLEPKLGTCAAFQVKTFMHEYIPAWRKSFFFFMGCRSDLGCSIVIRGGTADKLAKIKRITELMLDAAYSLKLETVLLRDQLAKIPLTLEAPKDVNPAEPQNNELVKSFKSSPIDYEEHPQPDPLKLDLDVMILPYLQKILSSSPFVKFPPPYLMLKMRDEIAHIKQVQEKHRIVMATRAAGSLNSPRPEDNTPNPDLAYLTHNETLLADEEHLQRLRFYHSFIENFQPPLSPFSHQSITILYCNVSTVHSLICQAPQTYTINYYKSSDLTLGQFLELSCFDLSVLCGNCDSNVTQHSRSYVHGNARVTVTVEDLPSPIAGMESTILMWSYCKVCEKVLPIVPMAEEVWNISLGKYLELTFYHEVLGLRAGLCPHDLHRDHVRYFGLNDLAARFEYEPIDLMEVHVPPSKLHFNPDISIALKSQDFEKLQALINGYWDSVIEKVSKLQMYSDSIKSESGREDLEGMAMRVGAERSYTLQILQQTYLNSHPTDTLALNLVLRIVQEKALEWDSQFQMVIRNHFQSEKDLRRLTTHQIRRLFPDKETTPLASKLSQETKGPSNTESKEIKSLNDGLTNRFLFPELGASPTDSDPMCYMVNVLDDLPFQLTYKPVMDGPTYRRYSLKTMQEEKLGKGGDKLVTTPPSSFSHHHPITPIPRGEKQVDDYLSAGTRKYIPRVVPNVNLGMGVSTPRRPDPEEIPTHGHKANKVSLGGSVSKATKPNLNSKANTLTRGTVSSLNRSSTLPKLHLPLPSHFNFPTKQHNLTNVQQPSNLRNGGSRLARADKSVRSRYNLKPVDKAKAESKPALPTELSSIGARVRRSNTTATSRPSRMGKPTIEVYLNTSEAVKEESESDEEPTPPKKGNPLSNTTRSPMSKSSGLDKRSSDVNLKVNSNIVGVVELNQDSGSELSPEPVIGFLGDADGLNPSPPLTPTDLSKPESSVVAKPQVNDVVNSGFDKGSLIQTLSTFLGGPTSLGQMPLQYVVQSTEHLFPDSPIVIREDEPSSIIAFTLSSRDYLDQMTLLKHANNPNYHSSLSLSGMQPDRMDYDIDGCIEHDLKLKGGAHLRYQLHDGALRLTCKIFFASQFDALRRYCDRDSLFVESLARCVKWSASGGKSGSIFLKTRDDRLVMKEVSKAELDAFLKFAPLYFNHMADALFDNLPVLLAKIFGIFRINIKNTITGKAMKIDVLIMENLFYQRKISRIFDLKGSMRNRHVQSTGKENEVLLDENLMELICKSPIFIRAHAKQQLHMAIFNDTKFLSSLKVMDYSLLVGIDEETHELVIGIVDFIRTFTWDKKLESWVKESGFLGGGGEMPTIVSPSNYKHRFRAYMDKYFLMVPDKFYVDSSQWKSKP